jgi:mono/diheme cytochrome c family protein
MSVVAFAQQSSKPATLLDQGWDAATRHFYYFTSQGAFLLPAAWLEALEDAGPQGGRFMAPENMALFGFIVDSEAGPKNPYGWPIGFAIDTEAKDGIPHASTTCAMCHTGQIEYRGKAVRIDGGQANIDQQAFGAALAAAVIATGKDSARRKRFIEKAIALGYPKDRIDTTFEAVYQRILKNAENPSGAAANSTPAGRARLDALSGIANNIFAKALVVPANAKPGIAPINYPYLWDIWLFDYVQYNASQRQPMGRDVAEAMGAPGVVQLADPATGELYPEPRRWQTNIRPRNLFALRTVLDWLKPPPWPADILGEVDGVRAEQGRGLFIENCAACHGVKIISGTSNPTEWHVPLVPLTRIGTDPNHAVSFAGNTYDATKLGLSKTTGVSAGLFAVTVPIKRQAYIDAGIPESEWEKYDGYGRKDAVDATPCGYKARPLLGTWATGPFLHNGSVPTVYDLLSETRPQTFVFGSPEFDPVKLGFMQTEGTGTLVFDSTLPGNSNAGHWFTNDTSRPGKIGRALDEREKFAIIEYLKAATPDDYPKEEVTQPAPPACANDPDWAKSWIATQAQ